MICRLSAVVYTLDRQSTEESEQQYNQQYSLNPTESGLVAHDGRLRATDDATGKHLAVTAWNMQRRQQLTTAGGHTVPRRSVQMLSHRLSTSIDLMDPTLLCFLPNQCIAG